MSAGSETVFARASGAGRAGVAVFRISGPAAFSIGEKLAGALPEPKRAGLRSIRNAGGELIDEGLVITFKNPSSFTGEDVVELHLHGSAAVEAALYGAMSAAGARPAEAGEFARRALTNGKLDLAEIEGLSDLLEAETNQQRMQALRQLGGELSQAAESWRNRLLAIMAPLEADIDFPDEEDIPAAIAARAGPEIDSLIDELEFSRAASKKAMAIREGVKIAIIGAPNAGKSSLLNRLAGSDRAIVSETPGTTRDVIEVRLDLGGLLVSLFDTAGLRENSEDSIEIEGMRRTRITADAADIRILMKDCSRETFQAGSVSRETKGGPDQTLSEIPFEYGLLRDGDFIILNKLDLKLEHKDLTDPQRRVFGMSVTTGEGYEEFLTALGASAAALCAAEDAPLTRVRHTDAVSAALAHLSAARLRLGGNAELAAEDVRLAARALGRITGVVDVEDVLESIFSSFCIGK
ncbi:MAG: tRNA uridine-5-carboxymethylaminomethyl(34) synthesis GTPase MnmE [Parvularculaceae bacterium]|nr:tRNA uridine-5-carboxymethylaminomethyl(34) synthesis GTPase MnmE [Parvularculaceae bacterium]